MPAKKEKGVSTMTKEATFTCKYCGKEKPLSDLTLVTRFFPMIVACRTCEKRQR